MLHSLHHSQQQSFQQSPFLRWRKRLAVATWPPEKSYVRESFAGGNQLGERRRKGATAAVWQVCKRFLASFAVGYFTKLQSWAKINNTACSRVDYQCGPIFAYPDSRLQKEHSRGFSLFRRCSGFRILIAKTPVSCTLSAVAAWLVATTQRARRHFIRKLVQLVDEIGRPMSERDIN